MLRAWHSWRTMGAALKMADVARVGCRQASRCAKRLLLTERSIVILTPCHGVGSISSLLVIPLLLTASSYHCFPFLSLVGKRPPSAQRKTYLRERLSHLTPFTRIQHPPPSTVIGTMQALISMASRQRHSLPSQSIAWRRHPPSTASTCFALTSSFAISVVVKLYTPIKKPKVTNDGDRLQEARLRHIQAFVAHSIYTPRSDTSASAKFPYHHFGFFNKCQKR